ncbi:MAG: NAD(P)/FAD-dependent oxidoreductase, partial [Pseudomonadota bacterium]|nr:NAD(P)/FAD-dependent oxidoreductase [Pseudomonadota bacterium]
MPDAYENMPARLAETWLAAFNTRLAEGDAVALAALFEDDSHWRDIVAFSWDMETVSGADAIAENLLTGARPRGAQTFALD